MKAKEDSQFTDLHTNDSLMHFNKWMYSWVNNLERSAFEGIIKKALKQYEPCTWNLFSKRGRSKEINQILKDRNSSNADCLANIFARGGMERNSFNGILFNLLLETIQVTLSFSGRLNTDAQLIMQIVRDEAHIKGYLQSFADYVKVMAKIFYDKVTDFHNKQLARLIQTPETSPLYRFFNYTNENRERALGHLPLEIVLHINEQLGPNNPYYQKAKALIALEAWPKNENEFKAHELRVVEIVNDCINKAFELTTKAQIDETQKDTSTCRTASYGS
ncbi:Uncharacterised protein [Legionella beliardensis]|uniref:Uncharacterized protein n=1 Tax=Legionella beliardensis TaxID=91822 RepID=A0A378I4Q9_9GAMM|nr:hypothetical protein [Legionella beliardensis]STX30179.1 Uncharacterised protein [Legionella beliardensis]